MIEAIEGVCNVTVHVKPPVADEVLLVEDGAIGAEEGVVCQRGSDGVLVNTDVEHLAVTLQCIAMNRWLVLVNIILFYKKT